MANTLTAVMPSIFAGLDKVSRELIGFIPAVQRDANLERAAVGQTVTVPVVPAATGGNITPASVPPDDGDVVVGSLAVTISKSKYSAIRWNGEEQLALGPTGQYNKILGDQFSQAFRYLANQVEVDIGTLAAKSGTRAYGTAGTTPFGTAGDLSDFAGVNKILDDNGAPIYDRRLVLGTAGKFNLEGKQSVLFKANEAATDDFLRRRVLTDVMGFGIGTSAGVQTMAAGAGTGYLVNGATTVGQTAIIVDTGTGTINAGDVVTFAGDTNKYVVAAATTTLLTIGKPGLLTAVADNSAITSLATHVANVAFTPNAMVLAARAPAIPEGGDSAEDRTEVVDPVSGIGFQVSVYREYRRVRFEVALAWGVGLVKAEDIAILMG